MALKDSSGRITIDEVAAQNDVRKISQARDILYGSKRTLDNIISQASGEQGQTASAIVEKATELNKQINSMIERLDETSSFISNTVAHYQEVDRLLKEAIQNSMKTSAAVATTSSSSNSSKPAVQSATTKQTKSSSKSSSSSQKSSAKKSDNNGFDDIVDSISDAFKKWF